MRQRFHQYQHVVKSPLKAKPLRNPGESVDRELQTIRNDEIWPYSSFATVLVTLAAIEWLRWNQEISPSPILYSGLAALSIAVCVWKIKEARKRMEHLRLGRDGEKAVGQYLERFRASGAQVFHDVPGTGFNIDHVLIHETGVYVIETKTISKPKRGAAKLVYDGDSISKGRLKPDRNPISQVRGARKWLLELLQESTGKAFPAQSVVVYPGWYIESTVDARASDVWALNPKALPSFISHRPVQMSAEDVHLCTFHLGRYIRAVEN